jgi:hypothetical protein
MRLLVILIFVFFQNVVSAQQQIRVAELFTLLHLHLESAKAKAIEMGFTFRPLKPRGYLSSVLLDSSPQAWIDEKGEQYSFEYQRSCEFIVLVADEQMTGIAHPSLPEQSVIIMLAKRGYGTASVLLDNTTKRKKSKNR